MWDPRFTEIDQLLRRGSRRDENSCVNAAGQCIINTPRGPNLAANMKCESLCILTREPAGATISELCLKWESVHGSGTVMASELSMAAPPLLPRLRPLPSHRLLCNVV